MFRIDDYQESVSPPSVEVTLDGETQVFEGRILSLMEARPLWRRFVEIDGAPAEQRLTLAMDLLADCYEAADMSDALEHIPSHLVYPGLADFFSAHADSIRRAMGLKETPSSDG